MHAWCALFCGFVTHALCRRHSHGLFYQRAILTFGRVEFTTDFGARQRDLSASLQRAGPLFVRIDDDEMRLGQLIARREMDDGWAINDMVHGCHDTADRYGFTRERVVGGRFIGFIVIEQLRGRGGHRLARGGGCGRCLRSACNGGRSAARFDFDRVAAGGEGGDGNDKEDLGSKCVHENDNLCGFKGR